MTSQQTEILERIEAAFAGVRLETGVSLESSARTEAIDNEEDVPEFSILSNRDDWRAIAPEQLDRLVWWWLDEMGFRYYLPAVLCHAIRLTSSRDHAELDDWPLAQISGWDQWKSVWLSIRDMDARFSLLNRQQMDVVAAFIESLPNLVYLDATEQKEYERRVKRSWATFAQE